jgi:hypothetical protein
VDRKYATVRGDRMKGKKKVYCEKCAVEIISKNDLVVTNSFLSVVAYHEKCFSKELKGLSTLSVGNAPINGTASNVGTAIGVVIGVIVMFIPGLRYIALVSLLTIGIRLYSWLQYERHL